MSIPAGIVLGTVGSILINTGQNLQSHGMHALEEKAIEENPDDDDPEIPPPHKSRTWVIGTGFFVVGVLLNFGCLGLAPQSLLASLESIQFVTNLFYGWKLLGKTITKKLIIGTALTVAGTIIVIVFTARTPPPKESISELRVLWKNPVWITYIILVFAMCVFLMLTYLRYEKALNKGERLPYSHLILPITYSMYSASIGTISVVAAKVIAELLVLQGKGIQVFADWFIYFTLIWLITTGGYWLYRLNKALALFDPLFIIPLIQASYIFFAIVSGGIFFEEFANMKPEYWPGFLFGTGVMFYGLYLLAPSMEEDPDEFEEYIKLEEIPAPLDTLRRSVIGSMQRRISAEPRARRSFAKSSPALPVIVDLPSIRMAAKSGPVHPMMLDAPSGGTGRSAVFSGNLSPSFRGGKRRRVSFWTATAGLNRPQHERRLTRLRQSIAIEREVDNLAKQQSIMDDTKELKQRIRRVSMANGPAAAYSLVRDTLDPSSRPDLKSWHSGSTLVPPDLASKSRLSLSNQGSLGRPHCVTSQSFVSSAKQQGSNLGLPTSAAPPSDSPRGGPSLAAPASSTLSGGSGPRSSDLITVVLPEPPGPALVHQMTEEDQATLAEKPPAARRESRAVQSKLPAPAPRQVSKSPDQALPAPATRQASNRPVGGGGSAAPASGAATREPSVIVELAQPVSNSGPAESVAQGLSADVPSDE